MKPPADRRLLKGWTHALRYAALTIKHKWYVFLAGAQLGVPVWRLIVHDWSKFSPSELPAYGQEFFGFGGGEAFSRAWVHHQNHNPHHWEYWITRSDHRIGVSGDANNAVPLEMPETYVREMVADWCGASRTYTGGWSILEWVEENIGKMRLHPVSKILALMLVQKWEEDLS